MARFEEYEIALTTLFGNLYNMGSGEIWEIAFFIISLAPDLGKPAFLILRNENMRVPWPGDCAKIPKLENVGFWLSPHFRIVYILIGAIPRWGLLYLYSRYTAMAAYYVSDPSAAPQQLVVP